MMQHIKKINKIYTQNFNTSNIENKYILKQFEGTI